MKQKIIKICIFFVLACLIGPINNPSAEEIDGALPPLITINCGDIFIDTGQDPDLCICIPIDNYNINVGSGSNVQVEVIYTINCPGWDDNGKVKIWFLEWPSISDEKTSGEYASGKLIISQDIPANTEFTVGLYAKIWYTFGGQGSECTEYSHCSTAPYNPNHPPDKPSRPSGPTTVTQNVEYSWTSSATDQDGDQLYLKFVWGDDTNSGWLGPVDSGEIVTGYHAYANQGYYQIKCQVKDEHGLPGPDSDPLPINCKKSQEH